MKQTNELKMYCLHRNIAFVQKEQLIDLFLFIYLLISIKKVNEVRKTVLHLDIVEAD